ncbi:MAG: hypothetical protein ACSNEK_01380 [Parachlamydiaceae bacterium]
MNNNNKHEGGISLIEAVETLSNIAEMDLDKEIAVSKTHHLIMQNENFHYKSIHWLRKRNSKETLGFVKEVFKVVLSYLKNFYKNEYTLVTDNKTLEGIKTIMVLVGEAAKKIDRYTDLFHLKKQQSVTESREYKQLQDFYLKKISRTIDEGVLGKWLLALTQKTYGSRKRVKLVATKGFTTKREFVDLESVKKDTDYELFMIRKEDGTRFFNSKVIRNIKLICDFGSYFGQEKDPLIDIAIWKDRQAKYSAEDILQSVYPLLREFYREGFLQEQPLARSINKLAMSLMLACNPSNLITNESVRSCYQYFKDFQLLLRQTLTSSNYQQELALSVTEKRSNFLIDVIHAIVKAIYQNNHSLQDLKAYINYLLEESHDLQSNGHLEVAKTSGLLWNRLAADYAAMQKLFRRHPNGPLNQVLNVLEASSFTEFDPYYQENIPNEIFSLERSPTATLNCLRLPCPTRQEFIQKADVIPEFKAYLRALEREGATYLLFNLQESASWKSHARCVALQDLANQSLGRGLVLAFLSKNTEFYHQMGPYYEANHTEPFIEQLKDQLSDDLADPSVHEKIKNNLTDDWVAGLIQAILTLFFSKKNVLSRESRLDFIELAYFFLELKIIELVAPSAFSFTCKDGIDLGTLASVEMFSLLNLLAGEKCQEEDYRRLNVLIYGPSMINRERIPLAEPFNRMISVLRRVESIRLELGEEFKLRVKEVFKSCIDLNKLPRAKFC